MTTVVIGSGVNTQECDVEATANALFTALTSDITDTPTIDLTSEDFTFEKLNSDLYTNPETVDIEDVTLGTLSGTGAFDKMMAAVNIQLKSQFDKGRITADQFADVYTKSLVAVLANATQFALNKDKTHWESITAQMMARVAEVQATQALVELETTKVKAAQALYDMNTSAARYALTKVETANAEQQHCLIEAQVAEKQYTNTFMLPLALAEGQHKVTNLLPLQAELAEEQVETARAQTVDTRRDGITSVSGLIGLQKSGLTLDNETKEYNLDNILVAQLNILEEQRESERAKTLDTRSDALVVAGSVGKQKALYDQQIDSFIKDGKYKVAKMYLDSWITQKTLDEGLAAPTQLTNSNIDAVIESVRSYNDLV